MSPIIRRRVHLIYGIVLAALIVTVGVCFALSCLSIYMSGDAPFTRERIAIHYDRIAIPVYLCIAGVVGGVLLSLFLPLEGGRVKPRREAGETLAKLSARLDTAACDAATQAGIRKEKTLRRILTGTAAAVSVIALLPALWWCVDPTHFSIEDLNGDIITAVRIILPCAAVALGVWAAAVLLCGASAARETVLVKSALTADEGQGMTAKKVNSDKRKLTSDPRFLWAVRGVILAVGLVFVVLGVLNGGMADVLGKAIRICTECIGLG